MSSIFGVDIEGFSAAAGDVRGRDRRHLYPGRVRRLAPRFTDDELGEVRNAAREVGMTPTGFLAEAALAYARRARPAGLEPVREQLRLLQLDLFETAAATGRISADLHDGVAVFAVSGVVPQALERVVRLCEQRLDVLDDIIDRIDGRLR
ncbi:hypothetical protein [Actinoplanes cyaneus]|nr:hypothetical protein [Actinoplanes cyaneus]